MSLHPQRPLARLSPVVWLLVLACILSVGCGDANRGESKPTEPLVIYAARNENLVGSLIERFSESSGIETRVKYGSTSELAATLNEEGENSPADVFYTRDPGGLEAVSSLLSPLPDDILNGVPGWARSPKGKWVGTSARTRVVVYNTERVSERELPDTIEGFTSPEWKGRIGWSPTSGPTQTMITAMRVTWGEDRTRQWLEGMKANDAIAFLNHTATVAGVGVGEVDIGLVNHYYLLRFLEESGESFPARNHHLRGGGPGNLVIIVGASIVSTTKNRANAERFLRFLLSPEAQQYLTEQAYDYPLADSVAPNAALTPLSEIRRPDVSQTLLGDIKGTESLMREVGVIP